MLWMSEICFRDVLYIDNISFFFISLISKKCRCDMSICYAFRYEGVAKYYLSVMRHFFFVRYGDRTINYNDILFICLHENWFWGRTFYKCWWYDIVDIFSLKNPISYLYIIKVFIAIYFSLHNNIAVKYCYPKALSILMLLILTLGKYSHFYCKDTWLKDQKY